VIGTCGGRRNGRDFPATLSLCPQSPTRSKHYLQITYAGGGSRTRMGLALRCLRARL
jgi:hypothetical protein